MSGCPDGTGKADDGGLWLVDGEGFGFECDDEDGAGVDDSAEVDDSGAGDDDETVRPTTDVHPAKRQLSTTSADNGRRRTPNTVPWRSQLRLPRREGSS
jgi:hypothetical protein